MAKAKPVSVSGLDEHLGYWLRFVSNHVSQAFTRKLEGQGVTVAEWVLLRALFQHGGITSTALAKALGMTRGAISKLVDRLERKQLLSRADSATDRRVQHVALTTAGQRLVPKLAQLADENDREFFGHLTERQKASLARQLQSLVQRHGWKDLPVN